MKILVLNGGSSSHKSCLFDLTRDEASGPAPIPVWRGSLDWTHQAGHVELSAKTDTGESIKATLALTDKAEGLRAMVNTLVQGPTQVIDHLSEITGVGHRVVHGGRDYQAPVRVDGEVKATIRQLIPLAPAHNPANLQGIEAMEQILGSDIPQMALFDTAFHTSLPEAASAYGGPYGWLEQGIRRYGFHGISHQYVAQRAADLVGQDITTLKILTCHLGNGCSLAAVRHGYSVDTTMGFTPLDGLVMGSRSGSVDPGILLYLMRQGHTVDQLDALLNQQSGLKGLSGQSNDMRLVVEAMEQGDDQAQLAVDIFIHRLRRDMGAMVASLGGLDVVVFTAGIGENSPLVWQRACEPFECLGLKLIPDDDLRQAAGDQDIAAVDSTVRVLVIHTQEEWAIAQACISLLQPTV